MELTGKIIAVLPARSGVSTRTNAEWKSQEYVLETHDQYPRKMCFNVFGVDKIEQMNIQLGDELTVSFDVDAREYQGRWFNSLRAWKVEKVDAMSQSSSFPPVDNTPFPPVPAVDFSVSNDPKDDLPF